MLKKIEKYLKLGWKFIPANPYSHPEPSEKKRPLLKKWQNKGTSDIEKLASWRNRYKNCSFNLVTGTPSEVVVLDVDVKNGGQGEKSLARMQEDFGPITTFMVKTPSGGYHYYYRVTQELRSRQRIPGYPDIEIRAEGNCVVLGDPDYEIVGGQLLDAPPWLIDLSLKETRQSPQDFSGRNSYLIHKAGLLKHHSMGYDDILEQLLIINSEELDDPLGEKEVITIAKSVMKYSNDNTELFTETRIAEKLLGHTNGNYIYCAEKKMWYVYCSGIWRADPTGSITREIIHMIKAMYIDISRINDKKYRKEYASRVMSLEANSKQTNIISIACRLVKKSITEFDKNKNLFSVANGFFDFGNMIFRKHDRHMYLTIQSGVKFQKDAKAPRFLSFLDEIFSGDKSLISYIARVFGRCLTGDTTEQDFYIFHGNGANGKSTLINVIEYVLSEYAKNMPAENIMEFAGGSGSNTYFLASLKNARAVFLSESRATNRLNASLIKNITGGESISARLPYGLPFEFRPQFKVFLSTNHRPVIKDSSIGIWRRLKLIPFQVSIPEDEQEKDLVKILKKEGSGILNWMIDGYKDWKENGMRPPNCVIDATKDYRAGEDIIASFVDTALVVGNAYNAGSTDLYSKFKEWAIDAGENVKQYTQRRFIGDLSKVISITKKRRKNGVRYEGVGIREDSEF